MAMLRRQKDTDAARRKKTGRPIFRTIFNAMMLVTLVEVVLLAVSIAITNVDGRLNQNAKDMLNMQVRNRVSYVQDLMQDAQNLTDLSEHINNTVLAMQEEGQLDLAELNTSREKSDALLTAIAPELVNTLRAKPVSGIFVVLNTVNLHNLDVGCGLPGIYLRDLDPDARPSEDNADLMIERGSSAVVKKLGITTDKSWQPTLRYYGLKGNGFSKTPFQTAWEDGARLNAEDYGRWTTSAYKIGNDSRTAIAYSQPLILPDGTIYGVVGVELLTSYLQTKLPYSELQDGNTGTYFLVSTTADEEDTSFIVSKAVTSSEDMITSEAPAGMMNCELRADECWLTLRNKDYYAVALPITLYSRNAPFSNERWHREQQGAVCLCRQCAQRDRHCHCVYAGAGRAGQSGHCPQSGPSGGAAVSRSGGRAGEKAVPAAVPYQHPGAGPSGRCTDQLEQRAAEQLHKVFAHHGHGQCGAGRL